MPYLTIPTTAAGVVLTLFTVTILLAAGFVCYAFGWLYRAKHERDVLRRTRASFGDRAMSTEERAAVDLAFLHVEQAFEELQAARLLRKP